MHICLLYVKLNCSTIYLPFVVHVFYIIHKNVFKIIFNLIRFHSFRRIVLNSTISLFHFEYHLGVCVSPLKDTTLDESCLAVKRKQRSPDVVVEDLCIGRGLLSQLIDHRGQSCFSGNQLLL